MLKKIGIVVVVLLVLLIGVIYTRPAEFEVTRSRTLSAPPSVVYAQIADFHRWPEWSPWEERDPNMKREFSGPGSGIGAKYSWTGNKDVGEGRMTITEAQPTERVAILLEFLEPFAATSVTEFKIAPSGQGTKVDWTMRGENGFPAKAMSLFMNMDKMIGADFDAGLAKLDKVTAASAAPAIPSGG